MQAVGHDGGGELDVVVVEIIAYVRHVGRGQDVVSEIGLRVAVHEEHLLAHGGEGSTEIVSGHGLPHSTLMVDYSYYFHFTRWCLESCTL